MHADCMGRLGWIRGAAALLELVVAAEGSPSQSLLLLTRTAMQRVYCEWAARTVLQPSEDHVGFEGNTTDTAAPHRLAMFVKEAPRSSCSRKGPTQESVASWPRYSWVTAPGAAPALLLLVAPASMGV